ncbi:MAG: AraC family transcriptional regulator [Alphaproteobacteria bacterium]|nr:AraC family transcriptional regulator [Alphaproteobacteria bacterium]
MASPRDPLQDVLTLLRPRAAIAAELRAHGPWRLAFTDHAGIKFGVIVQGGCGLFLPGRPAEALRAGDIFLLTRPPPYEMASDAAARPLVARSLFSGNDARTTIIGDASATPVLQAIGGHFDVDATNVHLLECLPMFVRIPAAGAGALRDVIRLLVDEVRQDEPGRLRVLDQLAQLVLTYTLRWLDGDGRALDRAGWLKALADPRIGASLRHIHGSVAQGTSLDELAGVAGMSRTAFTTRFKELVGHPPLTYALRWRMSLAKDALRTTDRRIGELAFELGYKSESAFSLAFRREVGASPRAFRVSARRGASPPLVEDMASPSEQADRSAR